MLSAGQILVVLIIGLLGYSSLFAWLRPEEYMRRCRRFGAPKDWPDFRFSWRLFTPGGWMSDRNSLGLARYVYPIVILWGLLILLAVDR